MTIVTLAELLDDLNVEEGAELVHVTDECTQWWTRREDWDAALAELRERTWIPGEDEPRLADAYSDLCSLCPPVWGEGAYSADPQWPGHFYGDPDDAVQDAPCIHCGTLPVRRECRSCGTWGYVTDCGHLGQPRPIAGEASGCESICDDCASDQQRVDIWHGLHDRDDGLGLTEVILYGDLPPDNGEEIGEAIFRREAHGTSYGVRWEIA